MRWLRRCKFFFAGIGLAIVWVLGSVLFPYPADDIMLESFAIVGGLALAFSLAFLLTEPGLPKIQQLLGGYAAVWVFLLVIAAYVSRTSDWIL